MGSIWLDGRTSGYRNVVDVLRSAGVRVETYAGWETRSRSSGGFEQLLGIVVHHTASNTSSMNDSNYCVNGPDAPIANCVLDRAGLVRWHAGGASNHAGKGGGTSGGGGVPWVCSRGTVPGDSANSRAIGIEASNAGDGRDPWPVAQQDAYVLMVRALCDAYGLDPLRDVWSHAYVPGPNGWTTRKIDPKGPSRWSVNDSQPWDLNAFRTEVAGGSTPRPPTPGGDDDMPRLGNPLIQSTGKDGQPPGCVFLTDGNMMSFRYIQTPAELDAIKFKLRQAGLSDAVEPVDMLAAFGVIVDTVPDGWKQ